MQSQVGLSCPIFSLLDCHNCWWSVTANTSSATSGTDGMLSASVYEGGGRSLASCSISYAGGTSSLSCSHSTGLAISSRSEGLYRHSGVPSLRLHNLERRERETTLGHFCQRLPLNNRPFLDVDSIILSVACTW